MVPADLGWNYQDQGRVFMFPWGRTGTRAVGGVLAIIGRHDGDGRASPMTDGRPPTAGWGIDATGFCSDFFLAGHLRCGARHKHGGRPENIGTNDRATSNKRIETRCA
jgi:hypothetical protein